WHSTEGLWLFNQRHSANSCSALRRGPRRFGGARRRPYDQTYLPLTRWPTAGAVGLRVFHSAPGPRSERTADGNRSHVAINSAAISGPMTKPFRPNTASPPRVEINTI